jgi:hypothetical protein
VVSWFLLHDCFIVTQNSHISPDVQKPRHRDTDAN